MLARVGRPSSQLHQTWDLSSSKLLARCRARWFCGFRVIPKRRITVRQSGYVRLALAAACSSRKLDGISLHQAQLCFVHDATECPWELYRWLSNGLKL